MFIFKKILVFILTLESRLILAKYKPYIIAITGSVGKTSAKDAIYCVVRRQYKYPRKSEKSLNSEIGLPLTIIGVPNAWHSPFGWFSNIARGLDLIIFRREYPDCLVLEIGADHPGDISKTVRWLKPDCAVLTRISRTPVHVEFFASPEQVFQEKSFLARAVKPGGKAVLYADDERLIALGRELKDRNISVVTFGTSQISDVRGGYFSPVYTDGILSGMTFKLEMDGSSISISLPKVVGLSHSYSLLAAAAVGKAGTIPLETIIPGLSEYVPPRGRMNIIAGQNETVLIDDTYNSSPDAVESALETLISLETSGIKVALLGDMMELGSYASEQHRIVGVLAAKIVSRLVTVGPRSRITAGEAKKSGLSSDMVHSCDSASEAAQYIIQFLKPGDIVLIKGSQSTRMEVAVKALMREPDRAPELLVRQEREWLMKN